MHPTKLSHLLATTLLLATLAAPAQAAITSITKNTDTPAKYAKLELTVNLSTTYANPFDPDQADLSAEFTSPTKKIWKVNGFYDGKTFKIRFAANEVGNWSATVKLKDADGTLTSQPQPFAVADSKLHGWVKVAPNKRYLACDDGSSFYGVGSCHAWAVTPQTLDQMKALGFNTYVYWNGTYDRNGGGNLIESIASGLGKYDQPKCARVDSLIDMSESKDMSMIFVLLPHDYACENVGGTWPAKWSLNPYQSIVSSDNYYSDDKSWSYQEKQYRYIIARWGYSRAICGWQTVDEISGTNGWKADPLSANLWTAKIAAYFQTNDPFKHPTTASQGGFWDQGNKANDLPNTEIYGNYATANLVNTVQRLWNSYEKPCIMGETGAERDGPTAHRKLWACLANGISITPLLWQFNQGWDPSISAQYPAFNKFIADINFAALKNPALAKVTIPGMPATFAPATTSAPATTAAAPAPTVPAAAAPAAAAPAARAGGAAGAGRGRGANAPAIMGVWAVTSDQITFGWMIGTFSGLNLHQTGLANKTYKLEWWNTTTGVIISTATVAVTDGTLTSKIPTTTQPDIAFKIIAPSNP